MGVDGAAADEERLGDLTISLAVRQQAQNLQLAGGETGLLPGSTTARRAARRSG